MVRFTAAVALGLVAAAGCQKKDPNANASPPGQAFEDLELETTKVDGGHDVAITVTVRDGETPRRGAVPYTAEPLGMSAQPHDAEVEEQDLFGSGLAFDLDGDGDTSDRVPIGCDGKAARVGATRIEPAMGPIGELSTYEYEGRVTRLGERGAYVLLYTPCSESTGVAFGLSEPGEPIELHEVEGPALQVIVFEPQDPGSEPDVTLDDLRRDGEPVDAPVWLTHTHEPIVTPSPAWHALRWVMVPLDPDATSQRVTFRLRGGTELRMVTASIQEPGDGVDRARSHLAVTRIQ